mmetsp:Transcript_38448/g.93027  ORF Transcript_38448/g.93027 Transcript_38448/m.93027 type:complete len:330 (-) Transcript_38448:131-1120(-)
MTNTDNNTAPTKTLKESDIYDRQIRLWGAESQAKMKNSKVLYVNITGTSAEVIKNLVLAGIAATLCDTRPVEAMADAPHFFSIPKANKKVKYNSVAHAVKPLVEDLNMLLGDCPILEKSVPDLGEEDLKDYTVIVASQIPLTEATRLAQVASKLKKQFYLADCFGYNGAVLAELGQDYQFRPEQGKKLLDPQPLKEYLPFQDYVQVPLHQAVNRFHKKPPKVYVLYRCLLEYQAKTGKFPSQEEDISIMEDFLKGQEVELDGEHLSKDDLQQLAKAGVAQLPAVCSVLGGMLGNEIIKVISGKGEPANNTILLDGGLCKAWTFLVKAKM